VPQGVLCEGTFCTHSWSWVEITHLCHPLHNVPVRFFFSLPHATRDLPRPFLSSVARLTSTRRRRRRSIRRPAGKTAGDGEDESSAAPSPSSS
jgi:hypothetical protein